MHLHATQHPNLLERFYGVFCRRCHHRDRRRLLLLFLLPFFVFWRQRMDGERERLTLNEPGIHEVLFQTTSLKRNTGAVQLSHSAMSCPLALPDKTSHKAQASNGNVRKELARPPRSPLFP